MLRAELSGALGAHGLEVALDVPRGECLAIAGPSGAGKTTILRLIAGTLRPPQGRIACGDEVWLDTGANVCWAPERRRCGYVFQDYALFPHLSAWRNVAYGLRGARRRERRQAAVSLLERVGLAERADARPLALSGGERQRVALARALAARPSVLLLDEPLSALDPRTRAAARRVLLDALRALEVPVVLVTHEFHDAALLGDSIAMIDGGRIIQRGSATDLAAAPASAFVADFTGAVLLTGIARNTPGQLTLVELDGGGLACTTDAGTGRVALSIYPWEITLTASPPTEDSAQNHLPARITALTTVGNRSRVGLMAGQPLVAEVTAKAVEDLQLTVGRQVVASWKATATRLLAA